MTEVSPLKMIVKASTHLPNHEDQTFDKVMDRTTELSEGLVESTSQTGSKHDESPLRQRELSKPLTFPSASGEKPDGPLRRHSAEGLLNTLKLLESSLLHPLHQSATLAYFAAEEDSETVRLVPPHIVLGAAPSADTETQEDQADYLQWTPQESQGEEKSSPQPSALTTLAEEFTLRARELGAPESAQTGHSKIQSGAGPSETTTARETSLVPQGERFHIGSLTSVGEEFTKGVRSLWNAAAIAVHGATQSSQHEKAREQVTSGESSLSAEVSPMGASSCLSEGLTPLAEEFTQSVRERYTQTVESTSSTDATTVANAPQQTLRTTGDRELLESIKNSDDPNWMLS